MQYSITNRILKDTILFCPPLKEQTQIANYLDHKTNFVENIIAQKEQLIIKLKEQRQAIIKELVTKGLNPNVLVKDSVIDWVDKIPKKWNEIKMRYVFEIIKNISGELGYDVLSVTQRGLKVKDITNYKGQFSMDYSKYQIVEKGDFVMNHMDLLTGYVDISKQIGVTSPDYRVFRQLKDDVDPEYFLYLFQMAYKQRIFYSYGQGVSQLGRWRLLYGYRCETVYVVIPRSCEKKNDLIKRGGVSLLECSYKILTFCYEIDRDI